MTTAGAVLDVARSQIGTREDTQGRQKYGAAYGMDGVAWCAEFQWWCFQQAGASSLIPKTAYTPTFASWFQQHGQASKTPRVGSLVFYDWPDAEQRIQHVGIVEAINADGTITTIEGNTTSGIAGDQSHGGGVWRRRRTQSCVVLYGHPAYSGAPAPAQPAPAALATLQYGMRNDSRVAAFQRESNAYNWQPELPILEPLGNYLEQTKAVVAAAQKQMGITGPDADGSIIGPKTKAALASRSFRW
jgi:peptidoglycan hydrolase-like protein with peptidoglycan-binding domain